MAEWYHVQIVWLDSPFAPAREAATAALRGIDTDAPAIGPNGYDGRWRSPLLTARNIADVLDAFGPCKVRVGRYQNGHSEWDDVTAEEHCKREDWHFSRPLFVDGTFVARRAGEVRIVADDGTERSFPIAAGMALHECYAGRSGAARKA